jgi:hypothetical protein
MPLFIDAVSNEQKWWRLLVVVVVGKAKYHPLPPVATNRNDDPVVLSLCLSLCLCLSLYLSP